MKLTDYIVEYIKSQGIDTIFGYTGGSIADLVDSTYKSDNIKFIQNYNEQASAFCANSLAQVTGKTGIAISSSGPGAINLLNGIANAYFDSIPCVFITGNVHSLSKNSSKQIRQNAFQETDIVSLAKNITKYAVYINNEKNIKYELQKAFHIANEGRKGPVLIDIPYDIQRKDINISKLREYKQRKNKISQNKTEEFYKSLYKSKRPLIIAGGGCQNAKTELREFLKTNKIPVVVSMRGLDLVPHNIENYVGFIGSYGNRAANLAIKYSDLLIVLGSRLDERQMGYKKKEFAPNAKVIQIDIDKAELGRKKDCKLKIHSNVKEFLNNSVKFDKQAEFTKWTELLKTLKNKYSSFDNSKHCASNFINYLSEITDNNAIISVDVGQNQIISSQVFSIKENQQFLSSSGLACMGYSLPAAIGAYYADKTRQVISINGDGGLQMNIQELETISRDKIPVKIVVLHNNCLGLIRKLQEKMFDKRYFASVTGFSCPDLERIANAYNMNYCKIENINDYNKLKEFINDQNACIIDVILPIEADANPEPGISISEQMPKIDYNDILEIENMIKEI